MNIEQLHKLKYRPS